MTRRRRPWLAAKLLQEVPALPRQLRPSRLLFLPPPALIERVLLARSPLSLVLPPLAPLCPSVLLKGWAPQLLLLPLVKGSRRSRGSSTPPTPKTTWSTSLPVSLAPFRAHRRLPAWVTLAAVARAAALLSLVSSRLPWSWLPSAGTISC